MNTPAHLLIGAAVFGRQAPKNTLLLASLGAVAPDLSLYLLAGVSLFVLQIPPDVVFGELYFSQLWQTIFAIDNSFVLWGVLLAGAMWRGSAGLIAFTAAGLLHLALDFPLHHDDARAHFFPLTNWVFESPFSYWDSQHHAGIIAPIESVLATIAAIVLWRRFPTLGLRIFWVVLLALEVWTVRQWLTFF